MNWNEYRKNFPERYWKESFFDKFVFDFLMKGKAKEILDFGGGKFGTEILNKPEFSVYFNDPFVSKPEWQKNPEPNQKFDAIIARGCINYLTLEEISALKNRLKPSGYLIFNSFEKEPNSYEKTFIDAKGEVCLEKAYCKDGVIHHVIEKHEERIAHTFFYYTQEQYKKALGDFQLERYSKNSIIILVQNI